MLSSKRLHRWSDIPDSLDRGRYADGCSRCWFKHGMAEFEALFLQSPNGPSHDYGCCTCHRSIEWIDRSFAEMTSSKQPICGLKQPPVLTNALEKKTK
ncbi:hypothetical protein DPV78_005546 [Talaromyces pinophilus]|nr:hypothetical protein DPV78_005546 [Talaromyces pinophilus]